MKSRSVFSRGRKSWITAVARTGLISKGIVYCLLGTLAFMSAFEIKDQSASQSDKHGVLRFVQDNPGGNFFLFLIGAGLLCYSCWRIIETFRRKENMSKAVVIAKSFRYFFSGVIYLMLSYYALKLLFGKDTSSGGTRDVVSDLLHKPFGQWLVAAFALIMAGVGIYQVYYGVSEGYRKHVSRLRVTTKRSALLLRSGKIGYISRGIVWLLIAFLLFRAAYRFNPNEAGNTASAFSFLEHSPFGSYLLALLALGLICYGVFNFIRARYENFER